MSARRLPKDPDEVEEWLRAEAAKMDTGELRELAEKLDELSIEFLSDAVQQESDAGPVGEVREANRRGIFR